MSHKKHHNHDEKDSHEEKTTSTEEMASDTTSHSKKEEGNEGSITGVSHSKKEEGNEGSIISTSHTKKDETSGNDNSITGVSDSMQVEKKKGGFWAWFTDWAWLVGLIIIGAMWFFSQAGTDPIVVNPTNEAITFQIDGKEYKVDKNAYDTVKLSHGEHTITMNGKEMGKFNFGWLDGESIINPTLTQFVEMQVIYSNNPEKYQDKLKINKFTFDGKEYEGPFTLVPKDIYIKKTWDYGVYEDAPSSITTKSRKKYIIKKELLTPEEFIKIYE